MPLPTGYGLQVRGPDDESIVLPVCLPPGFELASMVLCPEFLPRDEPQPAAPRRRGPAPHRAGAAPARPRGAPAPAARAPQRHAAVRLRQRSGLQPRRDVRRRGRCRRPRRAARPASRRTTSDAAVTRGAPSPGRPARVPARTIRPMQRAVAIALAGGLLAASAGAFGARAGAQARALADRGDPGRPDAESRPRPARPPRQRALLAALHRPVPRAARRALPCPHVGAGAAEVVGPAARSCATSAPSRIRRAGSSRAGTGATRGGRSLRTAPTG